MGCRPPFTGRFAEWRIVRVAGGTHETTRPECAGHRQRPTTRRCAPSTPYLGSFPSELDTVSKCHGLTWEIISLRGPKFEPIEGARLPYSTPWRRRAKYWVEMPTQRRTAEMLVRAANVRSTKYTCRYRRGCGWGRCPFYQSLIFPSKPSPRMNLSRRDMACCCPVW